MRSIDFGRAVKSPFDDPGWVAKWLLGALFWIIPIVNFAVFGAMIARIKAVAEGN